MRMPELRGFRALWRWGAAMLLALAALPGAAQQATGANPNWPKRPFLAIDTPAHAARGGTLVLTPDQKRALTVSVDGTLRMWDVGTGQLLQRFYLPRTARNASRLYALDVSPDGQMAAVGGFELRNSIALVSLQTGAIRRMIHDDGDITALAWSPDGRHIASGKTRFARLRGLRVHVVATGKEVFRDTEFEGEMSAIKFRGDGTFFAGSRDAAVVKLYKPEGGGFRQAAKQILRSTDFRMNWDAAGKTLLVGAHMRLDGETLAELPYELDRRNLPVGAGISRVQQAADGRFIGTTFSSGRYEQGILRHWKGDRRIDGYTEFKLPDPQIRDIALLRSGGLVYLTEEGGVAMVGDDGKVVWRVTQDVAAFDGKPDALKVTEAGQVTLPVAGEKGTSEVAFNLAQPGFMPVARVAGSWQAPRTTTRTMRVLAWEGSRAGTVNDVSLPYSIPGERSISLVVHSSEQALVYGNNNQRLVKVSDKGAVLWNRFLVANVVAVNLIESRGFVVAATTNGMLHVLRWSDGAQVAQYYLQPSGKRWIAMAADGYYEAGAGAEDVAGFVVNPTSQRVADFMPMSRFRASLLMPGLGAKAWEAGLEADAVKALRPAPSAAQKPTAPPAPSPKSRPAPPIAVTPSPPVVVAAPPRPELQPEAGPEQLSGPSAVRLDEIPPRVEIVSPGFHVSTDNRQLRIRLRAISPEGAPVTQVRAMVASVTVASRSIGRDVTGDERELVVDVPAEDSEVRVIAENRFGASVPTVIRVTWTGAKQQAGKGNLYVLAAGISKYDNPEYNLDLASKDARDFVASLRSQRGAMYNEVVVKELLDKDASKAQVEAGFEWLKQNMTARDTAIVFFAGHGLNDGANYYFITRDADIKRLEQTAVPFDRIRAGLTSLPGRALIFVDTCHSGNVIGRIAAPGARDNTSAINSLASSENGLVVFASSTGAQESQENPSWGNGAFTKAVVEGLLGAADFKKRGRVTYKGLDAYVSDRVDELTKGLQTPVTPVLQGVPDFAIAEVRKS
ncbi:MAG: caspase family protein [Ramlibacter sp.]